MDKPEFGEDFPLGGSMGASGAGGSGEGMKEGEGEGSTTTDTSRSGTGAGDSGGDDKARRRGIDGPPPPGAAGRGHKPSASYDVDGLHDLSLRRRSSKALQLSRSYSNGRYGRLDDDDDDCVGG